MADIRIADAAAGSRSAQEFRRLDQEEQALAQRLSDDAALKRIAEKQQDVVDTHAVVSDKKEEERQQRKNAKHHAAQALGTNEPDTTPETDQGHLLNVLI
jgi:adenylate kinase